MFPHSRAWKLQVIRFIRGNHHVVPLVSCITYNEIWGILFLVVWLWYLFLFLATGSSGDRDRSKVSEWLHNPIGNVFHHFTALIPFGGNGYKLKTWTCCLFFKLPLFVMVNSWMLCTSLRYTAFFWTCRFSWTYQNFVTKQYDKACD